MFGVNLGTWNGKPYDIKIKPDAEPYNGNIFPVPRLHELTLKQELDQVEALNAIKKVNLCQWDAPTFIIPENTEQFVLSLTLKNLTNVSYDNRIPYLISKISY